MNVYIIYTVNFENIARSRSAPCAHQTLRRRSLSLCPNNTHSQAAVNRTRISDGTPPEDEENVYAYVLSYVRANLSSK